MDNVTAATIIRQIQKCATFFPQKNNTKDIPSQGNYRATSNFFLG